jgi:hypothetical protein
MGGVEPATVPEYKPGALTSELPACSSEKGHRPPDLSVMGGALWPTELSRRVEPNFCHCGRVI